MAIYIATDTGRSVKLIKEISSGGEGSVWSVDRAGCVAKIYASMNRQCLEKLQYMVLHPPQDPNANKGHVSFAWPLALLEDTKGDVCGFLMPAIKNAHELIRVYSPTLRKRYAPVDWRFLHFTAANMASIMGAIHQAGYVVGDIKPQNILVNSQARPSIIDVDSFQVVDRDKRKVYRCTVGSQEFTPPELLDKDLARVNQTDQHDRFRLALMIYYLLFGEHPFGGKWTGQGESPDTNELIRRGIWLYEPSGLLQPAPQTIAFDTVHPKVRAGFIRTFTDGHHDPSVRLRSRDWSLILKEAYGSLQECDRRYDHYFAVHYGKCYWCERSQNIGLDVFDFGKGRKIPKPILRNKTSKKSVSVPPPVIKQPVKPPSQPLVGNYQNLTNIPSSQSTSVYTPSKTNLNTSIHSVNPVNVSGLKSQINYPTGFSQSANNGLSRRSILKFVFNVGIGLLGLAELQVLINSISDNSEKNEQDSGLSDELTTINEYPPEDTTVAEDKVTPSEIQEEEFSFETVQVNDQGEIIERVTKKAWQFVEDLGNGVMLEMVRI